MEISPALMWTAFIMFCINYVGALFNARPYIAYKQHGISPTGKALDTYTRYMTFIRIAAFSMSVLIVSAGIKLVQYAFYS